MKVAELEKPLRADHVRESATDELEEAIQDAKKRLFELRLQTRTDALENTMIFRHVKRNIARLKTELRRRTLEAGKEA